MRFSLFKQTKNKRFNYVPRYYDERKERLKNLKIKHGLIEDEKGKENTRRTNFRDDWKRQTKSQSTVNTKIRLFFILIILTFIAYIIIDRVDILSYF